MTGKDLNVNGRMMDTLWETILTFQIFLIREGNTRDGGIGRTAETSMSQ